MTQNPILKVLSTFQKYKVKSLLIGGQACIIYGAAEFSRDSDFVILVNEENMGNLKKALGALKAEQIYVPPLETVFLERGHACHFRCQREDVEGLRIDIMAKLQGCDSFDNLYKRRKRVSLKDGTAIEVIGLQDLAQSKKTQRDKDWLMLKRLVENDIVLNKHKSYPNRLKWWFLESRSPETLIALAGKYPQIAKECISKRPLLSFASTQGLEQLKARLNKEELSYRHRDMKYWNPLREELELLRHQKGRNIKKY